MVTQDRDEELVLFLEMRRREKEQGGGASLLSGSDNRSNNNGGTTETVSSLRYPLRRTAAEKFLYSENEKSDYEWLLTPPGTPQFEKESHRSVMSLLDVPNDRPAPLKSRLGNCREEPVSRTNVSAKHSTVPSGPHSSDVSGIRRPSSSGGLKSAPRPSSSGGSRSTSRPSTPTRRSTTPTTATSATTKASSSRSSTPVSRASLTAARPAGPSRSATPARSMPRPSSSQSLSATKSVSRSATPSRRPSTPSGPSTAPAKTAASANKSAPSRGTSPIVRSRQLKPPEMPSFSLEAPPNLRTTLPGRPLSASSGRPGASAPSSRSSSIERSGGGGLSEGRVRRQSCSPSRGRAPIRNANGGLTAVPLGRGRAKASSDSVSPVVMGTKMVERVVNMRKLAPSRQKESSGRGSSAGKPGSASQDSLGYGRTLSKSSIDMALRHMDIRRSVAGNLRPLVTKVPISSVYSVRSSTSGRSRPGSVSDSPLATSSTASSEPSVNNFDILCLEGSQAENDDLLSDKGNSSPRRANSER